MKRGLLALIEGVPATDQQLIEADKRLKLTRGLNAGTAYNYYLNAGRAPFDDLKVRQAFRAALNVDAVLQAVYRGTATRAWSVVSPASTFYDKSLEGSFGGDAAKANQLLDQAGWTGRDAQGFRTKNGKRLTGRLLQAAPFVRDRRDVLAQAVQAAVKQSAGIDLAVSIVDQGTAQEALNKGDFEVFDNSRLDTDAGSALNLLLRSTGAFNRTGVKDPELDKFLAEGESAADPGKRLAAYQAGAFLALAVLAASAPHLLAGDPLAADPFHVLEGPGLRHWFGTDQLGRDVFDRVVFGARHSLAIGIAATAIAVTAGILLGMLAGLSHRFADEALSRSFDALSAFPLLLPALLFIAIAGIGTVSLVVAIGIATLPHYARVVRSQTLVVRQAGYVRHAVAFGASRARLVARHVLPNVLGPIPVLAMIGLGEAILAASALSFLGMGPQPPSPEWGAMLSEGRGYLRIAWWTSILPGVAVTLTVIALTVVGRFLQRRFEGRQA